MTITVTDANEAPEIDAARRPVQEVQGSDDAVTCDYDENGTDPVGTFSAIDPEGENDRLVPRWR